MRYFNVCGADYKKNLGENRKIESHLIPLLLKFANHKNIKFSIKGNDCKTNDGKCLRDYVHVKDICDANLKMLDYLENGGTERCFNVGNGFGYSVLEIVKKVEEIIGKSLEINYEKGREGDLDFLVARTDLAKSILKWKPQFSSLDEIILSAWNWEKLQ